MSIVTAYSKSEDGETIYTFNSISWGEFDWSFSIRGISEHDARAIAEREYALWYLSNCYESGYYGLVKPVKKVEDD